MGLWTPTCHIWVFRQIGITHVIQTSKQPGPSEIFSLEIKIYSLLDGLFFTGIMVGEWQFRIQNHTLNEWQPWSHALKLLVSPFTMPCYFHMGGVTMSMKAINEQEHERGNQSTSTVLIWLSGGTHPTTSDQLKATICPPYSLPLAVGFCSCWVPKALPLS